MWAYRAKCVSVHDGDTVRLMIDLGFEAYSIVSIRLLDVWAPEVRGPERLDGLKSKEFIQNWMNSVHDVASMHGVEWPLIVETIVDRSGDQTMTFTRYVGTITSQYAVPISLNEAIVAAGFASKTEKR